MRSDPKLLLLAVLALLIGVPTPAAAQSAAFAGTFVYVPGESDDIHEAIEQSVRDMNFIKRPIARGRLRKTNEPYGSVTISHTPNEILIATDGRVPIVSPADGTPIQWQREDGETFDISTEWRSGKLAQTFRAGDGQRENLYSLSADGGTLTMHVTVSSPQLPRPVVYDLVFRRRG